MVNNPVTAGIMLVILFVGTLGVSLILNGSFIGPILLVIALLMIKCGWSEHGFVKEEKGEQKIPIVGFLTFLGDPFKSKNKCVTVNSSVILAPVFGISSIKVNMTPITVTTKVDVLSLEPDADKTRIQYPLNIFSTIAPDEEHLDDFVTYGNGTFDKIKEDYNGIVVVATETIASAKSVFDVAASGSVVSEPLQKFLIDKIKDKKMGITIKFVKAECKIPDKIAEAANKVFVAKFESTARVNTAIGLDEVTKKILVDARNNGDTSMNYAQARQLALTTSLLEEGELSRNQFEVIAPAGTTVNFFGPVGGQKNKQGQNQTKGNP